MSPRDHGAESPAAAMALCDECDLPITGSAVYERDEDGSEHGPPCHAACAEKRIDPREHNARAALEAERNARLL